MIKLQINMTENNHKIKILIYWKKRHKYEKQNDYMKI